MEILCSVLGVLFALTLGFSISLFVICKELKSKLVANGDNIDFFDNAAE